jgi:hypothetical protein
LKLEWSEAEVEVMRDGCTIMNHAHEGP